ncbi:MBL fold metallo-hydrolase [Sphingomonas sp. ACRSK]|uniref:MBL fold metallo-hydrolase n=1 Tax=Sphingomonas sp. ACRSK TaxID=2918213 RepID=UPI001EF64F1D|nr:MBL fold metallo-hydrolase [Sphingomonas sp. ACRSK]
MARNRYYQGPLSDHFDGVRFFNPGQPATDRGLPDMLRWKFGPRPATWPQAVPVTQAVPEPRVAGLSITAVGHATLLIQAAGVNLLTDPVWSERASPFTFAGPKRVTAPGIAFDALPRIDAVLLSHNHYDHLDMATLKRLHARDAPLMVMPLGNDAIVKKRVPAARTVVGDWGDRIALPGGAATTLVPANHWSARGTGDRRMALWAGHWIETPVGRVYFAGDSGWCGGGIFRDIAAKHGAPDVALLPIGAYAPRWFMAPQHADPEEAVAMFELLGAAHALGIHWGTFQLTDEAREEPVARLAAALAARAIAPQRFIAATPGDTYSFAPAMA